MHIGFHVVLNNSVYERIFKMCFVYLRTYILVNALFRQVDYVVVDIITEIIIKLIGLISSGSNKVGCIFGNSLVYKRNHIVVDGIGQRGCFAALHIVNVLSYSSVNISADSSLKNSVERFLNELGYTCRIGKYLGHFGLHKNGRLDKRANEVCKLVYNCLTRAAVKSLSYKRHLSVVFGILI